MNLWASREGSLLRAGDLPEEMADLFSRTRSRSSATELFLIPATLKSMLLIRAEPGGSFSESD